MSKIVKYYYQRGQNIFNKTTEVGQSMDVTRNQSICFACAKPCIPLKEHEGWLSGSIPEHHWYGVHNIETIKRKTKIKD